MSFTRVAVRAGVLGLLLTTAVTASATASAVAALKPVTPVLPNLPSCASPTRPGPGYNASIGNQENGKTICATVGEKLLVSLSAPATTGLKWSHIQASPAGVLTAAPLTITLSRGVTAANFLAVRGGVVELSSQRHVCPPVANGATCEVMLAWEVKVVVHPVGKLLPEANP